MEKNKKIKKYIINLIIFVLLIVLTFSLILKDQDISQIFSVVKSVKKEYIAIAVIAVLIYFSCEAINVGRVLKALGEKRSFLKNLRYTLIGFFFSSITPAASGGQPMEIYYMHKEKISVANSTLALLMQLSSFQVVTIIMGIICAIINFDILKNGFIWFLILGIALNLSALALLIIGIFSKRLSEGLIKICVKLLKFFRVKNIEQKQEKIERELSKYQESALYIKQHKVLMLKTILTTLIQVIAYYSIPYWVYCAFGYSEYGIIKIITLQAILYATVSGIPSPGAVGVSEGGFLGIFKNVFPEATISSAMLLNRGVNFYLFVIISAIIVMITAFKTKDIQIEEEVLKKEENVQEDN